MRDKNSLTAKYLRGELACARRKHRREINERKALKFYGAWLHNLKGVDVRDPAGSSHRSYGCFGIG